MSRQQSCRDMHKIMAKMVAYFSSESKMQIGILSAVTIGITDQWLKAALP